jgi:integrase
MALDTLKKTNSKIRNEMQTKDSDEPEISEIDRLTSLDPVNRKHLEKYVHNLELKQLKDRTIKHKLWKIYSLIKYLDCKDLPTVTREELEEFVIHRRKTCSPFTLQGDILELKLFYRWISPDKEKDLFQNIKIKKPRRKLPVSQLITREDIKTLVEACDNQRDRALIMLLWDSGCRISEVLSLNIGHIQFDRYGAVVIVDGKTGRRRLRLIDSVPDLQLWLNIHSFRKDPSAPLFLTRTRYGVGRNRLNLRTVQNRFKYLNKKLNMGKPTNPHAIRHGRLTDLAKQGFSEMELRLIAGWEASSTMPEVYVHLSGGDVERKMLEKAGFVEDTDNKETSLQPIECPRCKNMNPYNALFCSTCSMALTKSAAMTIETKSQEAEESDEYHILLEKIKRDLLIEQ